MPNTISSGHPTKSGRANYLPDHNIYKFVSQLEIVGAEKRIPDGIIYINGLPLVVFEFKSSIRAEASVFDAFNQLTVRYRRDIAELFKYNAFCVLSDGVNNKAGSLVLFSSIGLFALTLNTRYTHAISRVRDIYQDIKQSSSAETHKLSKELDIMVKRCHILKWSFGLLLGSGISSGLFLLGSILARFVDYTHEQTLVIFVVLSVLFIFSSMIFLFIDVMTSLKATLIHIEKIK